MADATAGICLIAPSIPRQAPVGRRHPAGARPGIGRAIPGLHAPVRLAVPRRAPSRSLVSATRGRSRIRPTKSGLFHGRRRHRGHPIRLLESIEGPGKTGTHPVPGHLVLARRAIVHPWESPSDLSSSRPESPRVCSVTTGGMLMRLAQSIDALPLGGVTDGERTNMSGTPSNRHPRPPHDQVRLLGHPKPVRRSPNRGWDSSADPARDRGLLSAEEEHARWQSASNGGTPTPGSN